MSAGKGSLYLDNQAVSNLLQAVSGYEGTVQDALYAFFQSAYILSVSNCYRGKSADAFKSYLTNGPINIVTECLDISSDLTLNIQTFAKAYLQYESSGSGRVSEQVFDEIARLLKTNQGELDALKPEFDSALAQASAYVSVVPLNYESIFSGYSDVGSSLSTIRNDLYSVDDEALSYADVLYERISSLRAFIECVVETCYSGGVFNADVASGLAEQAWFKRGANVTLQILLEEDPFAYAAGQVSIAEDQWVVGLCQDVFVFGGYSAISASGEAGINGNSAFAKGRFSALQGSLYGQITDYASAKADVRAGFAEGDVKVGFDDDYKGFRLSGELGVLDAKGELVFGSKEFNGFVSGEVKVACAEGDVAFEFEDDGEFAIGLKGSATGASATAKTGFSFLSYSYKDDGSYTGEEVEESLFGAKAGVKANAGGSFALWAESKTAFETPLFNVNATTLEIDLSLLVGIEAEVTVPTPYFKWPW